MQLIDDSLYEEDEDFSVYIVPSFNTVVSPKYNKSLVIIKPDANDGKYANTCRKIYKYSTKQEF